MATSIIPRAVFTGFVVLLSVSATVATAAAPPAAPDDVQFERDVIYGKAGGVELKLNLARPKGDAKGLPCVVVIHGGGWSGGDRTAHDNITWEFARRGYVSATVGYRLAPKHQFPAQVQDVSCAVRYLRAHADKYGLDPTRIGAVGFSAGAHLSMMLGTIDQPAGDGDDGKKPAPGIDLQGDGGWPDQPGKVQAVVAFFGPTDMLAQDWPPVTAGILKNFLGGTAKEKEEAYRQASPVTHVNEGDAPTLIYQGTNDPLVPHSQAVLMTEALAKANVPGRVELMLGAGHGWGGVELKRTAEGAFAFFEEQLKAKGGLTEPKAEPKADNPGK